MSSPRGSLPPWGERELSESQRKQAKTALSRCLGSDHVSTRVGPRNTRIPYLDVATAIRLANEAFRYDGWSSSIISITEDFMHEERGVWTCCYTAIVRITLPNGCYHDGIGIGNAEHVRLRSDAIDKAKKSAVSDAVKRALRCFGEGLGNNITTDSLNSRGSSVMIYEDEFASKRNMERSSMDRREDEKNVPSSEPMPTRSNSMMGSKSLRTVVSPVSKDQLNIGTTHQAEHTSTSLAATDSLVRNAISEFSPKNGNQHANAAARATNIVATAPISKPAPFQNSAAFKNVAEAKTRQQGNKIFHTTSSNSECTEAQMQPMEPMVKQTPPLFSKVKTVTFA